MSSSILAALSADPEIRGALIVLTALVLLPGSVYLLLSTNLGAKVGFLVAAAGLTGWMATMGWIWVVYGIGIKGVEKSWHVEEVVTGDVAELTTIDAAATLPRGWEKLKTGSPTLGDAVAAADRVLAPAQEAAGHEGDEGPTAGGRPIEPVFAKADEYILEAGYETGGEDYWLPGGGLSEGANDHPKNNPISKAVAKIRRGPFHKPHYAAIQVRPVLPQPPVTTGAPPKPEPDTSKPATTVIMVRDLGNVRFPSALFAFSMTILFGVIASTLHRRDKEIMAAKASTS